MDGETVVEPGYYWNVKLKKLARLGVGEKLPKKVGPWEMVAREGEMSSSEVARRLFDRYPEMSINEFTYTTTSPLPRRLPMGDRPMLSPRWALALGFAGVFALGACLTWWFSQRNAPPRIRWERWDDPPTKRAMLEKELRKAAIP